MARLPQNSGVRWRTICPCLRAMADSCAAGLCRRSGCQSRPARCHPPGIAGLQTQYAEDSGIKSLKIRHNNVLGYFIEVTAQHAVCCRQGPTPISTPGRWPVPCASSPPNWRTSSSALRGRRPRTGHGTGDLRGTFHPRGRPARPARRHRGRHRRHRRGIVAGGTCRDQPLVRPKVDSSNAFAIRAGRTRSLRPCSATGPNPISSPMTVSFRETAAGSGHHRAQHGGQVHLPPPERADRCSGADGLFRAGDSAHVGVVDRLFSRVGAADDLGRGRSTSWWKWSRRRRSSNQGTDRSLRHLDEIGRGTATSTVFPLPGPPSRRCMTSPAAARSLPRIITN